jgi:hypothetical protein
METAIHKPRGNSASMPNVDVRLSPLRTLPGATEGARVTTGILLLLPFMVTGQSGMVRE